MVGLPLAGSSRRLRVATAVVLVLGLVATAVTTLIIDAVVRDQERRLLTERTDEIELVYRANLTAVRGALVAQGGILRATHGSRAAYEQAATRAVSEGPGRLSFAWLRPDPARHGYVVTAAAGLGLRRGEVVRDVRTRTLDRARTTKDLVATRIMGPERRLGFAMGPPTAPAGSVLYREVAIGPLGAPRDAGTAPFSELDVAIYGAPRPLPAQVLTSTTTRLPMRDGALDKPLQAGASRWLLSVRAREPLVGGVADKAPWVTAAAGLVGSLLVAALVEIAARRRATALAAYASEHNIAETLQRSLLPVLPDLPGLDLAARYLASGAGQQVGGDWFDVFPISGGRVGLAVGDVIGHDLEAASAMAQIRAALRAYAVHGDPPATVITALGHLVDTFSLTQLVTVVYGVLEPVDPDGSRLLRYTNAGHLPPFLRHPDGYVEALTGGGSVVIGAPMLPAHAQAELLIEPGATLVLFTDGLVEVPGSSLDDALDRLSAALGEQHDADADTICRQLLSAMPPGELRDDVALLAVRLTPTDADIPGPSRLAAGGDLLEG
jgi:serine phosphatase RsbU (regulator of sigma subunit)